MSQNADHVRQLADRLLKQQAPAALRQQLAPRLDNLPARIAGASRADAATLERRWKALGAAPEIRAELLDPTTAERAESYARNIENLIGTVKIPVGLAGPLRVNGLHAQGDFYVPLATTEAALVASYSRGAQLITEAGGCAAVLTAEAVSRSPAFAFRTLAEAAEFAVWAAGQREAFAVAVATTTRHGRLDDVRFTLEGNHVYLILDFTTGDASGQNMVTIAAQAVCEHIVAHTPVQPEHWFVEANLSGDKKASAQSFVSVRGRKVSAEVELPAELVAKRLHAPVATMIEYWRMSALGGVMSGTIGVQGHVANGLAALFLACGQDVACVAEAAVGVTRFEQRPDGALYAAVTLPNIIVGTVGGGTGLPSQAACLDLLGLRGEGKARALAEVCAALALAGELSIIGALAAQQFARAHQRLARGRKAHG